jgi:hypothetical protein
LKFADVQNRPNHQKNQQFVSGAWSDEVACVRENFWYAATLA